MKLSQNRSPLAWDAGPSGNSGASAPGVLPRAGFSWAWSVRCTMSDGLAAEFRRGGGELHQECRAGGRKLLCCGGVLAL